MSTALHVSCDAAAARSATPSATVAHSTLVLATTILASSLAFVDSSVVNVGLPAIGRSLGADASALLLLGGAAGDRFGRRRLLITGVALFALASLLCVAAPTLDALLGGRLLQGVGAAMLMPNSLAILGASFSGEAEGRAIGTWAATGAVVAGAVGPVLGGVLIDAGSWRAIFLLNLPLALGAIVLARRFVPRDADHRDGPLDLGGGALATLGLGLPAWALTEGASPGGWTATAVGAAVGAALLLILFVGLEKERHDRAMVPLPLVLSAASPLMGGLAGRIGPRLPLSLGPFVVGLGFLLALRIDGGAGYPRPRRMRHRRAWDRGPG